MVLKEDPQRKDLSIYKVRETWAPHFEADDDPDVVKPSGWQSTFRKTLFQKRLGSSELKFHMITNRVTNPGSSLCEKILVLVAESLSFGTKPAGFRTDLQALRSGSCSGLKLLDPGDFTEKDLIKSGLFLRARRELRSSSCLSKIVRQGSSIFLIQTGTPSMVDRTKYDSEDTTPKIDLWQAQLKAGLLSVEIFAMLGDSANAAKDQIKVLTPEDQLGGDQPERDRSSAAGLLGATNSRAEAWRKIPKHPRDRKEIMQSSGEGGRFRTPGKCPARSCA